jgi:hypothetical protein
MQNRTFIEIQPGIPEHRNSKYYRLNSVENNHGSWLLVGILQLAGNQLLGILKIPVVVQYNTVGIWLPVPVVIYFQSLVWSMEYGVWSMEYAVCSMQGARYALL